MKDTFDQFKQRERTLFGDNEHAPPRNRVSGASDVVDLTLILRQDRPLSLMVHRPEQLRREPWVSLPKSLIEYEVRGGVVIVTLPETLAVEKGLL